MADRTVTVKSSGGDYTTLNAALSGESADLVTNTRLLTIECYASAAPDSTLANTGTGYTVNSSYYIKITVPVGERHLGYWDTSKYYHSSNSATTDSLVIQESYTRLEYLQFYHSQYSNLDADFGMVKVTANNCIIKSCILKGGSDTSYDNSYWFMPFWVPSNPWTNNVFVNCVVFNAGGGGVEQFCDDSVVNYFYNCTGYCAGTSMYAIFYGGLIARNCIARGGTGVTCFMSGGTFYNCASTDGTADDEGGSGNRVTQTFSFVDAANGDLRLKRDDTGARRYGLNLYNDATYPFQDDITGADRGGSGWTWDIGASMLAFTQTVTVKSSGGDYTNLNAALSGESRSLASAMYQLTIECYASAAPDSTLASVGTGFSQTASYYVKITSPAAERHPGYWDTSKYRMTLTATGEWQSGVDCSNANYTRVEYLQIQYTYAYSNVVAVSFEDSSYHRIEKCIVKGVCSTASVYGMGINAFQYGKVGNNIVYNFKDSNNSSGVGIQGVTSYNNWDVYIFSNTVVNCYYGFLDFNGDSCRFFNDLASGNTIGFYGQPSSDSYCDYCASSQAADVTGTHSRNGQTFSFLGAEDFRLKRDDSGARRYGVNLYNNANYAFQDDITGADRGGSGWTWDIGASMLAFVQTVTVKSSGGDYTNLNAALSGESRDLTSFMYVLQIECYASAAPDSTLADTGTGYTVSSSYYIHVIVPTAERHAGKFDASKYYMTATGVNGIKILKFQEAYSRATGIQIYFNPSGELTTDNTTLLSIQAGGCVVKNCIVKGPSSAMTGSYWCEGILVESSAASSPATFYCINCLGYNFQNSSSGNYAAAMGNDSSSITGYWYNCTGIGSHASYTYSVFEFGTGAITNVVKNCLAAGVAKLSLFNAGTGDTLTYCGSQDTSADDYGGTGNRANQTFTFIDSGNEDFRLDPDDLGALGYGTNLYNDAIYPFQDDIEGQDRGGSGAQWDIGADEYIATTLLSDTTCWGHVTGVTEVNKESFADWTGTGEYENSGDSERLVLHAGDYMESPMFDTGARTVTVTQNFYAEGDDVTLKYRTGATEAACEAASWQTLSGATFSSDGIAQLRAEG